MSKCVHHSIDYTLERGQHPAPCPRVFSAVCARAREATKIRPAPAELDWFGGEAQEGIFGSFDRLVDESLIERIRPGRKFMNRGGLVVLVRPTT